MTLLDIIAKRTIANILYFLSFDIIKKYSFLLPIQTKNLLYDVYNEDYSHYTYVSKATYGYP